MSRTDNKGALTVETYPYDPVRLSCRVCGRSGQYRRATLTEKFGRDASMPHVLTLLADCPRRGNASDPCGVIYPDLATR